MSFYPSYLDPIPSAAIAARFENFEKKCTLGF